MAPTPPLDAYQKCVEFIRPVLLLAPRNHVDEVHRGLAAKGVCRAVSDRDNAALFDWIARLLARQGIGNRAAEVFLARNGSPTFAEIADLVRSDARCPRMRSYWTFAGCGFRRSTETCNTPHHRVGCPVTLIPARKGALAEAAIGLWLFVRDCCNGDLVRWIDQRLASLDGVGARQLTHLRASILEPLIEIPGTGPKVWSMIMAELLLGGDSKRRNWIEVGASFVAVDSLVHAFLHRTGVLSCLSAAHAYGPACYGPNGCTAVIERLAGLIDAREHNPAFPAVFPRWVQFAIWWFCAADGWAICNATKIDDAVGCAQRVCPAFDGCARFPMTG